MLFDSKFKHFQGKFQTHSLGSCNIETVFDNGANRIRNIYEEKVTVLGNGHRLRLYHKPLTNEEFIKDLQGKFDLNLVKEYSSSSPT